MNKTKKQTNNKSISEIRNYYETLDKDLLVKSINPNFHLHNLVIPFRCCITAPSGSGKTNYVFHLINLFCKNKGTFSSITIITADADEPLYNQLKRSVDGIIIKEGISNVPDLETFDKNLNHLIIFDDLVLQTNQLNIKEYFMRARKKNVSVIYLSQKFFEIPRIIRLNSNYLVFLNLDDPRDSKLVLSNYSSSKVDRNTLENLYNYATDKKFSTFLIDKQKPIEERFRKGLLEILNPDDFKPKPELKLINGILKLSK